MLFSRVSAIIIYQAVNYLCRNVMCFISDNILLQYYYYVIIIISYHEHDNFNLVKDQGYLYFFKCYSTTVSTIKMSNKICLLILHYKLMWYSLVILKDKNKCTNKNWLLI